ncbi:hypothetical protein [Flexithrix dorotheae]|uniref:hypothetical protein n=1 Tax=Flexithrix dorotheae TaxID=70993 RepID=UPI00036E7489|nr:hypothetical protein [Flexithrix dorotheae]
MKTLKTSILLLLFVPAIFSCEEDTFTPEPPVIVNPGISIFGTFDMVTNSKFEEINDHYVELKYDLEGEGVTNLMEIASIKLNYKKFIEISSDSSIVQNGSYVIKANSGEEISGGFGGHLYTNETGTEEIIHAVILEGTHQYKDCKGDIMFKITHLISGNLNLEINGKIFLDDEIQPQ